MFKWNLIRSYSVTCVTCKNHYETLGVKRTSTIAEIKSAYYKLSLKHHPDRQDGSREEFEKITNAYKVLGDHHNRKLYDRGAFNDNTPSSATSRNYYSQNSANIRRPDVPSGPNPIYDFDMWSRVHYGNVLNRRNAAKTKYEDQEARKQKYSKHQHHAENIAISILTLAGMLVIISTIFHGSFDDFDKPPEPKD